MSKHDKTVRQVYSLSDIALLAGILVVGLVCSFFIKGLAGLGYTILLCWVMMLPFWHHGYRIDGQDGVFSQKEILVARECKDEILALLDGTTDVLEHKPRMNGGALVNIYTRGKDGLVLARYFDYADFAAGKEYPLFEITPEKKRLIEEIETQSK